MPITISDSSSAVSNSQVASTLPHIRNVVRDNVSDATPLLSFLMGQMGVERRENAGLDGGSLPGTTVGGRDIHVPVQLLQNTTVGSYEGYDTLDVSAMDTDRYALFPVRQNSGALTISGREKRSNKGQAAIYNLLNSKTSRLIHDLREEVARQLVSDGTGNAGKDIDGLEAVISTATLAGLNPATFPRWQPGGRPSTDTVRHGIITGAGAMAGGLGIANFRNVFLALTQGTSMPDAVFVALDVWGFYSDDLDQNIRYTSTVKADGSFQALGFMGAPVFSDFSITNGVAYFLNSRHVMFMRDTEGDFAWINEGVEPADQDAIIRNMIVEGNVVTDNRRMLGKITGLTL